MEPSIALGANISRQRKVLHLTQDDLARHLGITKASVSKREAGRSYPEFASELRFERIVKSLEEPAR